MNDNRSDDSGNPLLGEYFENPPLTYYFDEVMDGVTAWRSYGGNGEIPWIELAVIAVASQTLVPYVKAISDQLGRRTADLLADKSSRFRRHDDSQRLITVKIEGKEVQIVGPAPGDPKERRIRPRGATAATWREGTTRIEILEPLPDDAILALADFDFTASDVRGMVLRWDSAGRRWTVSDPND